MALTQSRSIKMALENDDWREHSACRDTTGPAIEQIETAKSVCRQCEVQRECLEYALATNQDSGIWGGTSEEERRALRRQWVARQRRAAS